MAKNTLYRLVADLFNEGDIENLVERQEAAIFYDTDNKILYTWIGEVKVNIAQQIGVFALTGAVSVTLIGNEYVFDVSIPSDYDLPLISTLDGTNFFIDIKNLSGEDITVTAPDLIDGEEQQTLSNDDNMRLYISNNQYRIL